MTKRRKPGEVVLKPAAAGFIMERGYAQIHPEALAEPFCLRWHLEPEKEEHHPGCCDDPDCQEWSDLRMLPGTTLAQALEHLRQEQFTATAYHVNECEMADPPAALDQG